MCCLIVD